MEPRSSLAIKSPPVLLEDTESIFDSMHTSQRSLGQGVVLFDPSHVTQPKGVSMLAQSSIQPISLHRDYARAPPTARPSSHYTRPSMYSDTTGAISPGGPVALMSRAQIGLIVNFVVIGIVDGIARALVYPLFKVYLHLGSSQQQAAATLMAFGWTCKFVFGYLSDCVPICGMRRKPYAMIALVALAVFTGSMAVIPVIEPYMKPRGVLFNEAAPTEGKRYVVWVMFASLAHALLAAACEGRMVEFAHREGEYARGRIQCTLYAARYIGSMLSTLLVALGCSSQEYGGDFSFSLPLNALMGLLCAVSLCGLYVTHFHMAEDKTVLGSQPISSRLRSLWRFAERRATWQITIVGFLQACRGRKKIIVISILWIL